MNKGPRRKSIYSPSVIRWVGVVIVPPPTLIVVVRWIIPGPNRRCNRRLGPVDWVPSIGYIRNLKIIVISIKKQ